jgi:membrane-bound metal-dependent hydrolase YbcI (DUF457 family)
MLLLCHLFIGLVIGLLIFRFLRDRRAIVLAAIGSVLPDLIDKPLGHIILSSSIDFGRIYAHSGLFLIAIFAVGLVYRQKKSSWLLMALAAGLVSHLVLDSMWELPVTLFYPFQGDFGQHYFPNYVGESLAREIENAYEWVFGVSALSILLYTYRDRFVGLKDALTRFVPRIVKNLALLLVIMGMVAIIYGVLSMRNPFSGETAPDQNLIVGLAALVGGFLAHRIWGPFTNQLEEALAHDQ